MVKVGFICEGLTEKMFVESKNFQNYLKEINIKYVGVIDAKGNGNLLPNKIEEHDKALKTAKAQKIIILTDSDGRTITRIRNIIKPEKFGHILVIAVQEIEAWFLSDKETLRDVLQNPQFRLGTNVETIQKPSERNLPSLIKKYRKLIIPKKAIADKFLNNDNITREHFFNIKNAECKSAKEFLRQLENISKTNMSKSKKNKQKRTKK